jgi:large subunit ribosomal protein L22
VHTEEKDRSERDPAYVMEVKAVAKHIRISPRKIRLVMRAVKGKKVDEALNLLTFAPQKGGPLLEKLINSAVANANQSPDIDVDRLFIKDAYADEGPTLRRFRPRAMGRATRIRKRTSHLTVILDER